MFVPWVVIVISLISIIFKRKAAEYIYEERKAYLKGERSEEIKKIEIFLIFFGIFMTGMALLDLCGLM